MPIEKPVAARMAECTIRYTFGSSGMLSQQIQHGAEFDVFLSANEQYIDKLVNTGAVEPGSKIVYARGRIGLWSGKNITFGELASVRHLAIANPDHAPYGQAAKEALLHENLWEQVWKRTVY
jgi:molybdate transport system substrate-binding protein